MVLLSLLLQVQSVFACQMMDHNGLAEHCCCGEMKDAMASGENQVPASPCCDFSSELTLKGADLESNEPVAIQAQSSLELPQAAFLFILASLWPFEPDLSFQQTFWDWDTNPGHPGTHTYLSTLRLRI